MEENHTPHRGQITHLYLVTKLKFITMVCKARSSLQRQSTVYGWFCEQSLRAVDKSFPEL